MEYGQIFHVMRIGKYYGKNMTYRIRSVVRIFLSGGFLLLLFIIQKKIGIQLHFTFRMLLIVD